jgi:hypothetical protein
MKMTTFCVDVSGSVSDEQVILAMDTVTDEYMHGDRIIAFDHAAAEFITYQEVIAYALRQTNIRNLRLLLFKKGSNFKWRTDGAQAAAAMAFTYSNKVCLTDGYLAKEAIERFDKILNIEAIR